VYSFIVGYETPGTLTVAVLRRGNNDDTTCVYDAYTVRYELNFIWAQWRGRTGTKSFHANTKTARISLWVTVSYRADLHRKALYFS